MGIDTGNPGGGLREGLTGHASHDCPPACPQESLPVTCGEIGQGQCLYPSSWASLVAQTVKNLPAIQETQVQSLGWEDRQEKGMAKYSCLGNPTDRGAWQATVHGVTNSWTRLSD